MARKSRREEVIALFQKGFSPREIAEKLNMWETSVCRILRENGFHKRTPKRENVDSCEFQQIWRKVLNEESVVFSDATWINPMRRQHKSIRLQGEKCCAHVSMVFTQGKLNIFISFHETESKKTWKQHWDMLPINHNQHTFVGDKFVAICAKSIGFPALWCKSHGGTQNLVDRTVNSKKLVRNLRKCKTVEDAKEIFKHRLSLIFRNQIEFLN